MVSRALLMSAQRVCEQAERRMIERRCDGCDGFEIRKRVAGGHVLNDIISGTPKASAMCTCPKAGGLLMIASTANGLPVTESGEKVASQNPSSI
jgi:hypothetical protein